VSFEQYSLLSKLGTISANLRICLFLNSLTASSCGQGDPYYAGPRPVRVDFAEDAVPASGPFGLQQAL